MFGAVRDDFKFAPKIPTVSVGPYSANLDVAMHLENGILTLNDDDTITISNLQLKWDKLSLTLGIDLPDDLACVGGWCIVPTFWGCAVRLPKICPFEGSPDITIPLDLSGLVTSSVSATAKPVVSYFVNPARPASMSDLDAEDAGLSNKWRVFLLATSVDVQPFDVSDSIEGILENAAKDAIVGLVSSVAGWAVSLVLDLIGGVLSLIKTILGFTSDVATWIASLLETAFGLGGTPTSPGLIEAAIVDYFAAQHPIVEFEDPYPILPATAGLIPVKIPIRNLAVSINSAELVLRADVGA
jgi:hypothetical protein